MSAKASKSKDKLKPKLKTILANPHKTKCPSLSEEQLEEFGQLINDAMDRDPRPFATAYHIHLGLQSCLRAINQSACACIFLSLSLKPRYVLSLIARSAELKDETVPVFVQPHLEDFTEGLFGVRTMALVLPRDLSALGADFERWVSAHRRPKQVKIVREIKHLKLKRKPVVTAKRDGQVEPAELPTKLTSPPQAKKTFSSDFISFSANDDIDMDQLDSKQDKHNLREALNEIIEKSKLMAHQEPAKHKEAITLPIAESKPVDVVTDASVDSNDFLNETDYQVLTVHKIKPNPNRKRKKKPKKNAKNKKV